MAYKAVRSQFESLKKDGRHAFALLIDPDSVTPEQMGIWAQKSEAAGADFIFIGGSLMLSSHVSACVRGFKEVSNLPVVLFPGSPAQVCSEADALLYLSLISGRNPELLIGQHVVSAAAVKSSGLEVMSTGYMIIDGGRPTAASYMSYSAPIPADKEDIALCTAWAGEMQGKHLIYMDAGSGAQQPISASMIQKVSSHIQVPLIVGGGIRTPEKVQENCRAGAQVVVVGDAIEKDISLLKELSAATKEVVKTNG